MSIKFYKQIIGEIFDEAHSNNYLFSKLEGRIFGGITVCYHLRDRLPHGDSCDLQFLTLFRWEIPHVTYCKFNTEISNEQSSQRECTIEACSCKTWLIKLSIVPHALSVLTANIVAMHMKACRTSHMTIT